LSFELKIEWLWNPGTKVMLTGVAKPAHNMNESTLGNKKSADRDFSLTADFIFGPVCREQKSFFSALDNCSNRYRLVGGTWIMSL